MKKAAQKKERGILWPKSTSSVVSVVGYLCGPTREHSLKETNLHTHTQTRSMHARPLEAKRFSHSLDGARLKAFSFLVRSFALPSPIIQPSVSTICQICCQDMEERFTCILYVPTCKLLKWCAEVVCTLQTQQQQPGGCQDVAATAAAAVYVLNLLALLLVLFAQPLNSLSTVVFGHTQKKTKRSESMPRHDLQPQNHGGCNTKLCH